MTYMYLLYVADENTKIASDFSIRLDFKTSRRDGVLVSISHSEDSALALELYDGQVRPGLLRFACFIHFTTLGSTFLATAWCWHVVFNLLVCRLQLKFTAVNGGGRFSAVSEECEHCLCDDRWHSVTAQLIKNIVILQVCAY